VLMVCWRCWRCWLCCRTRCGAPKSRVWWRTPSHCSTMSATMSLSSQSHRWAHSVLC